MADLRISDLAAAGAANTSNLFEIEFGGNSFKLSLTQIITLLNTGLVPAVNAVYADIAARDLDEVNLADNVIVEVTDAVADPEIDRAGTVAWYVHRGSSFLLLAHTDLIGLEEVREAQTQYDVDTGAANAYVITLTPPITAYVEGQLFYFKATNANTGASTLNVNGLGAQSIVRRDGSALAVDEITAGSLNIVMYDGTNFQLLVSAGGAGGAIIETEKYFVGPDLENVVETKYTTPVQLTVSGYNGITTITYRRKLDDGVDTYTSETNLSTLNTWLAGLGTDTDVVVEMTTDADEDTILKVEVDRS